MSHKGKTAILFGLCTVLAACDDTSTRDLAGPEPTTRASEPALGHAATSALAFASTIRPVARQVQPRPLDDLLTLRE
jgi:hypothetical protein